MCCILCEEPVRSVLFGLAAVGVVAIVRTAQKSLKRAGAAKRNLPVVSANDSPQVPAGSAS
jgi:hypothetical protein